MKFRLEIGEFCISYELKAVEMATRVIENTANLGYCVGLHVHWHHTPYGILTKQSLLLLPCYDAF